MNTIIQLRPSQAENPTVRGGRAKNADYRQREYLTEGEIATLLDTAGTAATDQGPAADPHGLPACVAGQRARRHSLAAN